MENEVKNEATEIINLVDNLKEVVQFEIKNTQEKVKQEVVNQLVNAEVEIRKNLILEGLKTYDDLKDKLSKVKPDVFTYDAVGNIATEGFSKAKIDEKLKLEKQFKELETALNLAIDKGDYKKLQKK